MSEVSKTSSVDVDPVTGKREVDDDVEEGYDESGAADRPKRGSHPTEKGRKYSVAIKTQLFSSQLHWLNKAIRAAVNEIQQIQPDHDSLLKIKERISHMRQELGDIQGSLCTLGRGEVFSEDFNNAEMQAQKTISNIVRVLTEKANSQRSSKISSQSGVKFDKHGSVTGQKVGSGSRHSSVSSAISMKLQLRIDAAALAAQREGQAIEDNHLGQLECFETEEALRKARLDIEKAERETEEALRKARRETEEALRKARLEAEETVRLAEVERKKKESLRRLEGIRLDTKERENQAMLKVLDQSDEPTVSLPVLPTVSLLESHFLPSFVHQPSPSSAPQLVHHETVTVVRNPAEAVRDVHPAARKAEMPAVTVSPSPVADARPAAAETVMVTSVAQDLPPMVVTSLWDHLPMTPATTNHPSVFAAALQGPPHSTSGAVNVVHLSSPSPTTPLDQPMLRSSLAAFQPAVTSSTSCWHHARMSATTAPPPVPQPHQPIFGPFPSSWSDQPYGTCQDVRPSPPYPETDRPLRHDAQVFVPIKSEVPRRPVVESLRGEERSLPLGLGPRQFPCSYPFSTTTPSATPFAPPDPSFRQSPNLDALAGTLSDAIMLNRLPLQEPCIFTGDPLQYPMWRSAFSFLIERQNITSSEKLLYLQRYLGGQAKEAVTGFFFLRDDEAYQRAMAVLEKRFGDLYVVSQAFRTKLDDWANVRNKDYTGLRRFADFLMQCSVAAKEVGGLSILDDAHYLRRIVDKLPEWMAHRWGRLVAKTKSQLGRYPLFEELVTFVTEEADVSSDPVFGAGAVPLVFQRATPPPPTGVAARKAALATSSGPVSMCDFCDKQGHTIHQCESFANKLPPEKTDFVYKSKLCFGCLRSKTHISRDCRNKDTCKLCQRSHPTCLHGTPPLKRPLNNRGGFSKTSPLDSSEPVSTTGGSQTSVSQAITKVSTNRAHEERGSGLTAMIVPVFLSSVADPSSEVLTYALLDTMSNATFVVDSLAEEVHAPSLDVTLKISTLTKDDAFISTKRYSGLTVRSVSSNELVRLPPTIARPHLSLDSDQIPTPETVREHLHLRHLAGKLTPLQSHVRAGLLIGYDCAEALMPLNIVPGLPFGIETKLGWSIVGKAPEVVGFDEYGSSLHVVVKPDTATNEPVTFSYRSQVKEVSCADLLRVLEKDFADGESGSMSQDDVKFMHIVQENIKVNSTGHYEMPLPFRPDKPCLPDNRGAAVKRVMGLKRQFERKPNYHEDYVKFMNVILERGDAELVPETEVNLAGRWYIPHHGVYNHKKPGKIRVVFDCSARHQGTCLNDILLQGPDLISSLSGVLCRFRKGPVAFSCDVEKMYHQFHVSKPDCDYLRFLWWEGGDTSGPLLDYRMKVHIFGATSSPGCANFGLKQVARDNVDISPEASAFLQRDFYVDDGLKAKDSVAEAVEVLSKAREICERGSLRLHKIVSNSKELLDHFPPSEVVATTSTDLSVPAVPAVERTLGLHWNTDTDTLGFTNDLRLDASTRRGVLSVVASLYDPLGFVAPLVVKGRMILQESCREGLDWDDPLPAPVQDRWNAWTDDCANLDQVQIPRNCLPLNCGAVKSVELHHFSDASTVGYGQCSYLRVVDPQGKIHCTLVVGKARVTPLRYVTVPRLELTAAVLSVKMAGFLERELDFDSMEHFFWTDSQIVLAYLNNVSKRFHVFVANRVQQILQFSRADQWRHVPTADNPADLASRGLKATELMSSSWYRGPSFLLQPLPQPNVEFFEIPEGDEEVKFCKATAVVKATYTSFEQRFRHFSSKHSLIRGVALIIRRCGVKKGHALSRIESYEVAETRMTACLQREYFSQPGSALRKSLVELNAYKDPFGVWRVGGRANSSSDSERCKHPVILPRDSHLSILVARDCHAKVAHQGRMFTINKIRSSGYWILGMRHVVATLIRGCVKCRRLRGKASGQMMGDLPQERLEPSPPFTHCGVDCFGPFHVTDGRKKVKRYGLIVTCLASRAVHLETLDDMSTDAFINGLRRVIAIRGDIHTIWCDRGTNFVGACTEFKLAWKGLKYDVVVDRMEKERCVFKFNSPASSHMGGVWERQIRTVRNVLNGLLRASGQRLSSSSLQTLLYEVMAIVNSRPLSAESLESPDGPLPITPNHILTMKNDPFLPPPGVFESADLYVRQRWRCVQRLADDFWRIWRREYLALLQSRRIWQRPQPNVKIGDVVVVHDPNACRFYWDIGRVAEVFPGRDGLVRKVSVKMSSQQPGRPAGGSRFLERPIHKVTVLVGVDEH